MGGLLAFSVGNYDNTAEREQFRFLCGQLKAHYENLEDFCVFVGNYNIEGEAPHYSISLSIAKNTNQLSSYTKTKGLDKRRGCVKWFYNISAMLAVKVPSEIVYTNI